MSLTVLNPGPYSLLIDAGRTGSRALGVPLGGAADRAAFTLGNALVGNGAGAVALELTLAGPTLKAEDRTACVVFGASFSVSIGGRSQAAGTTFTLEAGETLRIGGTPDGVRGYLCVAGGFDTPVILGSRSALEPLKAGDVLKCEPSAMGGRSLGFVSLRAPNGILRAVDGPQRDGFPADVFFGQPFTVSHTGNRMGIRLTGQSLPRYPGELVSEAVAPGAVQITNDGLPVVLVVDGQTIGGYPKIAHIIRADLDLLAQLRPGMVVRFQRVSLQDAEHTAKERAAVLHEWLTRLAII